MPVTPFHLGPGLFFGMIFSKYLNLLAFLIGNIITDIEPFIVVVYEQFYSFSSYPYHGFLHTIIGAFLISLFVALFLKQFQQIIYTNCANLKLAQKCLRLNLKQIVGQNLSFTRIFFSVFVGTLVHLVFDAFTHTDVWPFWPSHFNPILGLVSYSQNTINCIILGILGITLLIFKHKFAKNKNKMLQ